MLYCVISTDQNGRTNWVRYELLRDYMNGNKKSAI